jgi:hypothetical protein
MLPLQVHWRPSCYCIEERRKEEKSKEMRVIRPFIAATALFVSSVCGFAPVVPLASQQYAVTRTIAPTASSALNAAVPDLDVVALVAGQENYGLAVVCVGEAIWSFLQAPSFDHAKVLVPAGVAALVLGLVSGPMITSGDASQVGLGLGIATAVSIGLGASYVARLIAPFSPSPKEVAFLGLLVAIAGFFSFSQNLVVDGFVTLPSVPIPTLPSIDLPF